ncbi:Scr1 family TA system antitoxin-like transcriptional regulator [Micromonospora sp. DT233]|uniref:Scr1 family TA system antitoxin-like transcriptional regulator n=1 Tax=Micromonospora sp. DT233 TaxID=3393432 RepID=UPI003CEFC044
MGLAGVGPAVGAPASAGLLAAGGCCGWGGCGGGPPGSARPRAVPSGSGISGEERQPNGPAGFTVVIATPPVGDDMVYVEGQLGGHVVDRPADVRRMVDVWESIRGEALPHQRSVELIAETTEAEPWT